MQANGLLWMDTGQIPAITVPVEEFRVFYLREFTGLVALAGSVSGDASTAEDVVQEALTKAHDRWDKVGNYEKPGTWVRRVVINLALNRKRRLGREAKALLRLGPPPTATFKGEGNDELWAAVAKLPGQQRAAVVLHYLEDRPVAEIAEILDCAEATARVHLHKARNNLSKSLTNNMSAPSTGMAAQPAKDLR